MIKPKRVKVYLLPNEAHPATWYDVEYERITFDPRGWTAVDKAGRKARDIPEPPKGEE